jgi:hypothetical protein
MYTMPSKIGAFQNQSRCHTTAVFSIENLSNDQFNLELYVPDEPVSNDTPANKHITDNKQMIHNNAVTHNKPAILDINDTEQEEVRLNLMNALQNAAMNMR